MERQLWPSQTATQVVRVDGWAQLVDAEVFPVGSKPKSLLVCPDNITLPFLIPGHRYLFKTMPGWREQQLWSEIIAYELSKLCGVAAPPCFAAFDIRTGQAGVLMEFFYGYPDEVQSARFVSGTDIIQRVDRGYNPKTGRPHEVQRNIAVCRSYGVCSPLEWWTKTLAFDALIGNTDRHAENWGLLRGAPNGGGQSEWTMAPPFDHGTSLGYEILENQLAKRSETAAIEEHIARGRHHCTWATTGEKHGEVFFTLCAQLCVLYPRMKPVIWRLVPTADAPIADILARCVEFKLPVKFSAARATFVERLIRARCNALTTKLGL
jgi:hypothetical protein